MGYGIGQTFQFDSGNTQSTYKEDGLQQPQWIFYNDLSGGLNTKKDPHALARNQLALSQNLWYLSGNSVQKRPGNVPYLTGVTASGLPGQAMSSCRFRNRTTVLVQSGGAIYFTNYDGLFFGAVAGTVSPGGILNTAQLFDPDYPGGYPFDVLFLVTGTDPPRMWLGPDNVALVNAVAPVNHSGGAIITPKYVATLFSHLFYAGEPTEPTAVYISDAFRPESFTQNALTATPSTFAVAGGYLPYLIGRNDGVNGGDITGLARLGASMIIYKQAAIYSLTQQGLFGDQVWASTYVSNSTGATAPRSIVAFDTFHCFLGIDGVYQTDGSSVRRISDNIPTFFDGTSGIVPAIVSRQTAVGVRLGQRYLLFFDDGNGTATPAGHPTTGIWFDFAKLDEDGYPTTGEIKGMLVNGAVALRGPNDDGTMVWCDGTRDRIGHFGFTSADFGAPITTMLAGKSDFMDDPFGPSAPIAIKQVDNVRLLLSVPNLVLAETLNFTVATTFDQINSLTQIVSTFPTQSGPGSIVGSAVVGTAIVGFDTTAATYQVIKGYTQSPGQGRVVQVGFSESSIFPWGCLGYVLTANIHNVGGLGET